MFVSILRAQIQIETDNGERGTFGLSDHAGVLAFLLENQRDGEDMLCSSSCDFPHDDGAPEGWSFFEFIDEVEKLASMPVEA